MSKGIRSSTKYVFNIALLYSLLIIISSLSFHYILKKNSRLLRETTLRNNEHLLLEKTGLIIDRLADDNIKSLKALSSKLKGYCSGDENLLYILIFSQSEDEAYFKMIKKIANNPAFDIGIKGRQRVKEDRAINYLQKGMFGEIADEKIYSSNGLYWRNVYHPFKIRNKTLVIEFIVSTSMTMNSINEYYTTLNKTNRYIIIISAIIIVIAFIITFLFTHNLSLFIKGLSQHIKDAADGKLDVQLNPTIDEDFSEIALSFNNLIVKLKELTEKEKSTEDIEHSDPLSEAFSYGVAFIKEKRIDDAIAIFKTLTILKPEGFASLFNLGVAYAKNRDYNNALLSFRKAMEFNPDHELTLKYIEKVGLLQRRDEEFAN
ncbi:MAG: tetratricopeptide repeat protein [Spirochaetota bacterium]|nr:tetratricopeptide repeat protein [Spirochaetota bacterium]